MNASETKWIDDSLQFIVMSQLKVTILGKDDIIEPGLKISIIIFDEQASLGQGRSLDTNPIVNVIT